MCLVSMSGSGEPMFLLPRLLRSCGPSCRLSLAFFFMSLVAPPVLLIISSDSFCSLWSRKKPAQLVGSSSGDTRPSGLTGKDSDAGKDWGQEEKGETEDEMVGWYHQLNGHEFEQTLGDGERQGSLVCCGPWGHKELDTTERLNSTRPLDKVWRRSRDWSRGSQNTNTRDECYLCRASRAPSTV